MLVSALRGSFEACWLWFWAGSRTPKRTVYGSKFTPIAAQTCKYFVVLWIYLRLPICFAGACGRLPGEHSIVGVTTAGIGCLCVSLFASVDRYELNNKGELTYHKVMSVGFSA
jgi:hypothetical protein